MNATAVDLSPLVNVAVQMLAGLFLAFASVAAAYVIKKFKLGNDALLRSLVMDAAKNAVRYGMSQTGQLSAAGTFNLASKPAVIEAAAGYLATHVPDALAKLGIDQDTMERLVEAKLAEAVGTSTAPAAVPPVAPGTQVSPRQPGASGPPADLQAPAPILPPVVPIPKS